MKLILKPSRKMLPLLRFISRDGTIYLGDLCHAEGAEYWMGSRSKVYDTHGCGWDVKQSVEDACERLCRS